MSWAGGCAVGEQGSTRGLKLSCPAPHYLLRSCSRAPPRAASSWWGRPSPGPGGPACSGEGGGPTSYRKYSRHLSWCRARAFAVLKIASNALLMSVWTDGQHQARGSEHWCNGRRWACGLRGAPICVGMQSLLHLAHAMDPQELLLRCACPGPCSHLGNRILLYIPPIPAHNRP